MKKVFFKRFWVMVAAMAVIGFMAGCDSPTDPGNDNTTPSAITYTVAQTGGADGVTDSAAIVFTFSASVDSLNLTAAAITVSGKASKGTAALTGSGTSRTLPITVNAAGTAAVSIVKDGIETATKSVTVFKAGELVPETVTITWHFNGGTAGTGAQHPTQIDKGEALAKPSPDPAKDGNIFGGWYTDSGLTQAYNFANTVTANLSLYAKWEAGQINPSHTHQWGDWTATTIEGTEQRECAIDQSHLEHRLTGTNRFTFQLIYSTSYSISKGTATGVVYIPAYYRPDTNSEYLPVTRIADSAFSGSIIPDKPNTTLTTIHIPSTVTSIGDSAFSLCTTFTSITIPASVTSIGNFPFAASTSLTNITVESGNPYYTSEGGILYNKAKTEILQYPSASGAITIPVGVTSIGIYAFYFSPSLTSVEIHANITSIGSSAFSNCTGLASITVDVNNLNYASQDGILYNKAKTSFVHIPRRISGAVTIPEGVTSIGNGAFSGCTSLTSINIPVGVMSIGGSAFFGCTSLTSITIPASVMSIGGEAFYHTAWFNNKSDGLVYVGKILYAYKGTMPANTVINNIPEDTIEIADSAFSGCTDLTSITIPASVTSIGDSVFYNCTSLTSITIPASVTSIGHSAFSGCTSLTSITIPANVMSVDSYAFSRCTSLISITIPAGVTSIGDGAFYNWGNTQTIYVAGHASEAAADSAWSLTWPPSEWRYGCDANIVYQGQ